MIGDTPYDAEAAYGAGAAAAGILTGGVAREALADAGCFIVARKFKRAACFIPRRGVGQLPSATLNMRVHAL